MFKQILKIVACFLPLTSLSQGIQDSVFRIPEVEVSGNLLFEKDEAGMKQSHVDSVVLLEKINANLSDVLSENTPVYIKEYGRGALATASFRGTAPSHTQVSWNGININSPMLGMVDFSLIPVYIIDDMSLKHGAASISEQSGGLGGHISIENEVDWSNRFSGRYYQGIGSFKTFDEFAQINLGNKRLQSKTRVYHNYSQNNYEYLNKHLLPEPELQHNENADFGKYGLMQEFYWRPKEKWLIAANAWYQDAYRAIPTVLTDESNDNSKEKINRQTDQTLKSVLSSSYYGHNITFRFHSGADFQQIDYENSYILNNNRIIEVDSRSEMLSWYNKAGLDYRFSEKLTFKVNGNFNTYDISSFDSAKMNGYDITQNEFSLFGGAFYEVNKHVVLSANLRKDWIERLNTPVIYTFGATYKPFSQHNLVAKLSYARNFHNPTLNDLYWQPGGNPDLKAEKGYTYESGLHYAFKRENWSMETQATAFYSEIDDWIIWLPARKGYWEPQNIRKVEAKGVEIMARLTLNINRTNLYLNANYGYTKTINQGDPLTESDESQGKQLPFIPRHSGNLFASVENRGFYLSFQHNSYSERYLLSSNDKENTLYPYFLNHASVGKRLKWKRYKLDVQLKINNLFDEFYRSVLNRFMPGRHYMCLIKIGF